MPSENGHVCQLLWCCSLVRLHCHPRYRSVLWTALGINLAMFVVEIAGGLKSRSVSLLADSVDFAGVAANYGLTPAVLSMGFAWRSKC